jgi:hypothetical protein
MTFIPGNPIEGNLSSTITPHSDRPCPVCGQYNVTMQKWESSDGAFEDAKFTCSTCQYEWWIDGIDS